MNTKKQREFKYTLKKYYFDKTSTLLLPFFFVTLFLVVILQQFPEFSIKQTFIDSDSNILKAVISLATGILAFLILSVIVVLYEVLRNRINKALVPDNIDNVEALVIPKERIKEDAIRREAQLKDMINFFSNTSADGKYGFIVGKSGSGKSTLLTMFYEKNYTNDFPNNPARLIKRFEAPDYIDGSILEKKLREICDECDTKSDKLERYIVIFDQYERTLENKEVFDYILEFLKETKKTKISSFFVITKDNYIDAIHELKSVISEKFEQDVIRHDLRVKPEEKDDMLKSLKGEMQLSEGGVEYKFFEELLSAYNNASMIEMNIARIYFNNPATFMEKGKGDDTTMLSHEDKIERILEKYFNKIFDGIEDSCSAMIILYAICCSDYSSTLRVSDFKNLTFLPFGKSGDSDLEKSTKTIMGILNKLKEKGVIVSEREKEGKEKGNDENASYIMTHDYLIAYLDSYCSGRLSEQVTTNIRFYCKEKKKRVYRVKKEKAESISIAKSDNAKSEKQAKAEIKKIEKDAKEKIDKINVPSLYYQNTVENNGSSRILAFFLLLLCMAVTAVCVWYEVSGFGVTRFSIFGTEINHTLLAVHILATGSAIFYVYQYLNHFAKIFFSKEGTLEFFLCIAVIVIGIFVILLSLVIYEISVALIGFEWLIIAFLHLALSRKQIPNVNEKARLKREGTLYVIITFILIALNSIVILFGGITVFHYLIFFTLVVMIIRQQIHKDFMLAKIGVFVSLKPEDI
jgi:hypothetical protein